VAHVTFLTKTRLENAVTTMGCGSFIYTCILVPASTRVSEAPASTPASSPYLHIMKYAHRLSW